MQYNLNFILFTGTYPPKQFQPPEINPYHVGYDQTEDGKPLEGYQSRSGTIDKRNCPLIKQVNPISRYPTILSYQGLRLFRYDETFAGEDVIQHKVQVGIANIQISLRIRTV